MFNNFIGGGQVFLHKVRMFGQVFFRSFHVSLLVGILLALLINWGSLQRLDWNGFFSYRKSVLAISFSDALTYSPCLKTEDSKDSSNRSES